jgi:small acid-soluble spore protein (thioredoxin-like protein)
MVSLAKPDDRSDNVEKLQSHINHTIENLEEAEQYLDEHGEEIAPQERQAILQNNENRRDSLQGLREEIRDEATDRRS